MIFLVDGLVWKAGDSLHDSVDWRRKKKAHDFSRLKLVE